MKRLHRQLVAFLADLGDGEWTLTLVVAGSMLVMAGAAIFILGALAYGVWNLATSGPLGLLATIGIAAALTFVTTASVQAVAQARRHDHSDR